MSEQAASYNVVFENSRAFKSAIRLEVNRLAKTDSENYVGPDPSLVRALIAHAGWEPAWVADLLRVDTSTIRRWVASREQSQSRKIPYAAWMMLLQYGGHTALELQAS